MGPEKSKDSIRFLGKKTSAVVQPESAALAGFRVLSKSIASSQADLNPILTPSISLLKDAPSQSLRVHKSLPREVRTQAPASR